VSDAMRKRVLARDGSCCRWCGRRDQLALHHVEYRSEGGTNAATNLVTLCLDHHAEVHTSKRRWQPVLMHMLDLGLTGQWMTVPETERFRAAAVTAPETDLCPNKFSPRKAADPRGAR